MHTRASMMLVGEDMNDSDSAALVQKVARGDHSAMMSLFDGTNKLLFGLVRRTVSENAAAEETLLDAYTRIWRQAGSYDPRGGTPLAWMTGIVRSCAAEKVRPGTPAPQSPGPPSSPASECADQRTPAVTEVAPPDYLRDLLALRIEREPCSTVASAPAPQAIPLTVEKIELKHVAPPRPAAPAQRARSNIVPWILAALFAAAAGIFFFLWWQSQKRSEQAIQWERDAAHAARSEADRFRSMTDADRLRKQEFDAVDAALASSGATAFYLNPARADSPAAAVVFWNTKKNSWIIIGHFTPLPAGKEHQVWFVTESGRRSAGLIHIDATGHGFATLDLPPDIGKVTGAEITLEPLGGSTQPSSPVIAAGKTG